MRLGAFVGFDGSEFGSMTFRVGTIRNLSIEPGANKQIRIEVFVPRGLKAGNCSSNNFRIEMDLPDSGNTLLEVELSTQRCNMLFHPDGLQSYTLSYNQSYIASYNRSGLLDVREISAEEATKLEETE